MNVFGRPIERDPHDLRKTAIEDRMIEAAERKEMQQAKVTQEQADNYMAGWCARHTGETLKAGRYGAEYEKGYNDCDKGILDFDASMGPKDLAGDGYCYHN
jgi:hypothetical protein